MRRASLLLTALLALGLAAGARAGGYGRELKFERITMQDGLPDSSVTAILQDHLGFLWIGTLNGLVRYDGYDFVTYKPSPDDESSISGRSIRVLYEDSPGRGAGHFCNPSHGAVPNPAAAKLSSPGTRLTDVEELSSITPVFYAGLSQR